MKLRKTGALLIALLALGVVAVSSASAAAVTERAEWFVKDPAAETLAKRTTLDAEVANHTKTELGEKFQSARGRSSHHNVQGRMRRMYR